MKAVAFQEVLDIVESLPIEQQETIIEIVNHRLIEERRNLLAQNIQEAKEEFARGEIRKGTVDDLMKEVLK